jgi:hypothetical protein
MTVNVRMKARCARDGRFIRVRVRVRVNTRLVAWRICKESYVDIQHGISRLQLLASTLLGFNHSQVHLALAQLLRWHAYGHSDDEIH